MRLEAGFPSQNMKDTDFSLLPKFPRSNQTSGTFQPRAQAHGENHAGNSERAGVLEENVTNEGLLLSSRPPQTPSRALSLSLACVSGVAWGEGAGGGRERPPPLIG